MMIHLVKFSRGRKVNLVTSIECGKRSTPTAPGPSGFFLLGAFSVIVLTGCASHRASPVQEIPAVSRSESGFENLFPHDGVPQGWLVRDWADVKNPPPSGALWRATNGILHGSEPRGTWLVSEKEYENFI